MNTSPDARIFMIIVLLVAICVVVFFNIRIAVRLLLKRKTSRTSQILWPSLGLLLVLCALDAFYIEPNWVQVTHHSIETPKFSSGANLRIVQLTDLHISEIGKREKRMLDLTAEQRPDIIMLTGDYLNHSKDHKRDHALLSELGKQLSQIAPTYAVEGNWDYDREHLLALAKGGVHPLYGWILVHSKNAPTIALGNLWWQFGNNVVPRVPGFEPYFSVLLCHMPETLAMARADWVDLMLAGHTHGGQVRIPIFGALIPNAKLVGKHQAGLYQLGHSTLYVSRGLGMEECAPQVRFWCRPEIAVIDIVGKSN